MYTLNNKALFSSKIDDIGRYTIFVGAGSIYDDSTEIPLIYVAYGYSIDDYGSIHPADKLFYDKQIMGLYTVLQSHTTYLDYSGDFTRLKITRLDTNEYSILTHNSAEDKYTSSSSFFFDGRDTSNYVSILIEPYYNRN